MDVAAPIRSGFLTKCGHVRKSWKRRWFTLLADGTLTYAEDEGRPSKGALNVGCATCTPLPDARFKRGHVFSVTSALGETLVMQADSDHDREAWVSSINRLASSTLFYSGVLLLLSTWRKVRGRDVTAGASNQNEPFCQAWKPKYAIVSGSRLAWFDSESAPAPASKPAGALGLRDGLIAVTASPPAPRDGAPRSSYISVSSADGGTTLQLGFVSPADAPAWELALRAATGDASSRSAFFASRSTADKNASGDGGTALPSVFPSLAVASNAHGSAERSSVSSEALTAQRDPAEEMELPRPGAADSLSTAALQSRIAELEAQHAAEAARRVDAERAAAAEALRAASLHTEREAARLREAKLEEELQRRSEAIAASPSRVHGGSSVVVALETPEQAADPSASQRRSEEPRVVALHDPAPSTTPMSEVHGRAARGSRPTDVATAVAEASMIAAALPLQSESGATGSVSANVPEPHSKTPTPQPPPPPPSEAAAAALLVSAAAPPLASSVLTPLDTPGVSSARSHRENGDNSSLRPVVAADWGLWTCDPDGEERVAMKRRIFDYLLRRTTVGSSPAQASYLETTAVPSVEAVFYQDARGDRVKYADASTFKLRLKRVFAEKAGSGGSGATGLTPLSSSFAAGAPPSPALSHSGSFAALPPRSSTPLRGLPVVDTAAAVPPAGASVRPSFAASDTLSGVSSRSPLRQELPRDRSRLAGTETLPRQQQLLLSGSEGPPRPDSRSSFASPAAQSRSLAPPGSGSSVSRSGTRQRGSDVSAAAPAHRDSALSALTGVTEEQVSSPYQAGDTSAGPRWGGAPHPWARLRGVVIRHFPAQADGAVRLALVLERRPSEPPVLKLLNKWQHRQCSECGAMQTTGLGLLNTGLPAQYCHYTELLFCERCMSPEPRPIPWRIVHDLDDTPFPVSRGAADYIDRIMGAPIIALSALAPRSLARSEALQLVMQLRARIADLLEAVAVNAAEVERQGSALPRPSAVSAASGDDDCAGPAWVLSEQPTPLRNAVQSSPAAAAAFRDCSRLVRKTVGDRLAFMAESVELLPLSLIVRIDEDGQDRVTPRLAAAARAIEQYAVSRGLLTPSGDSRGPGSSPS